MNIVWRSVDIELPVNNSYVLMFTGSMYFGRYENNTFVTSRLRRRGDEDVVHPTHWIYTHLIETPTKENTYSNPLNISIDSTNLNDKQKQVIFLWNKNCSQSEIARLTNTPVKIIKHIIDEVSEKMQGLYLDSYRNIEYLKSLE